MLQTPTIHQTIGNYLSFSQSLPDSSYEDYMRSLKLSNSSHFFPPDLRPKKIQDPDMKGRVGLRH